MAKYSSNSHRRGVHALLRGRAFVNLSQIKFKSLINVLYKTGGSATLSLSSSSSSSGS